MSCYYSWKKFLRCRGLITTLITTPNKAIINYTEGNKVAHCLARIAANLSDIVVWIKDVPLSVLPIVQADLSLFWE